MTELSFLLELLLEHELTTDTKKLIKERIKLIEHNQPTQFTHQQRPPRPAQSPSTQRMLDEMAAEGVHIGPELPMAGPGQIAQTPAAMAAMAQRNEAIRIATSGKEEKGRTSPRKF